MTFYERLLQAAAHAGISTKQSDIARALGVARQKVSKWKDGSIPETPSINAIAKRCGVDHVWLASGEGQMIPTPAAPGLSQEELQIIKFYRNAQPQRRKALYDMAKALGKAVFLAALSVPAQIDSAQAATLHKTSWAATIVHIVKIIINIAKQRAFQYA